jgi:hypothetical protein
MKLHKSISAVVMICLTVTAAQAEVVAGRWEKIEALAPGTAVIVSFRGGERLECTFNRIGPDEILFNELNGNERRLPRVAIREIETAAIVRDRLRNGILLGTLIGAAAGLAGIAVYGNAKTNGPVNWGDEDASAFLLGSAVVGGGIGAATGAILDASMKHREVLYRAK